MDQTELLRELRALPPAELLAILREVTSISEAIPPPDKAWEGEVRDTIRQNRTLLERLAHR